MEPINNLVIGSSGFVGRYLCQYLIKRGESIVEYDIANGPGEDCRFNTLPLNGIDRVYFLGWKVGGANYLYDPRTQKEQLDWNIKILSNTMDQLSNIPFVFVSSQLAENCDSVYGVLKRLGEIWTGLNGGVVVRLWNVYGAFEHQSIKSHVVADFMHQALKNKQISMFTTGEERRQFIYIEDVCEALHESFKYKGIYDASSLQWNQVYSIAESLQKYTNCSIIKGTNIGTTLEIPNKPLVPGWKPKTTLDVGIQKTIDLFKSMK